MGNQTLVSYNTASKILILDAFEAGEAPVSIASVSERTVTTVCLAAVLAAIIPHLCKSHSAVCFQDLSDSLETSKTVMWDWIQQKLGLGSIFGLLNQRKLELESSLDPNLNLDLLHAPPGQYPNKDFHVCRFWSIWVHFARPMTAPSGDAATSPSPSGGQSPDALHLQFQLQESQAPTLLHFSTCSLLQHLRYGQDLGICLVWAVQT